MTSGRLRREPGGCTLVCSREPDRGKARGEIADGGTITENSRVGTGVKCEILAAMTWVSAGSVALQQSSASRVGRHLPFAQQSAALPVANPAKQSNGRTSTKITATMMTM